MSRSWLLAGVLLLGPALAWPAQGAMASGLLAPAAAAAAAAAPDAASVPVLRQHVTDLTGTLTAAQIAELEAPLAAIEQRKGSQLTVLVVATTGDQPIEDYSLAVVEKNKLGRRKIDDGLLLLVAKDDRKARIEVGYGLEGVVTDALSSRVIREYLAPRFREGDYFGGLRDATTVLARLVDGETLPPPMAADSGGGRPSLLVPIILGLFIGLFASGIGLKPVTLRRLGAAGIAAGLAWLLFGVGLFALVAAAVAFLVSSSGAGRFSSGRGGQGIFPGGGGGGWGGSGGGWSGGGGSFGGGGASGGW